MQHAQLIRRMVEYEKNCPERVHHFIKVHCFAGQIAQWEHLDEKTRFVLETAAIVHDIGIRASLEKYGACDGSRQEQEGPGIARPLLEELGYTDAVIDRVCYLIAHHHTYHTIDGMDYQILVEADFLVNILENGIAPKEAASIRSNIFRTGAGIELFEAMYGPGWKRTEGGAIETMRPEQVEQVMEIWLKTNLSAHSFIGPEHWEKAAPDVRKELPTADVFVYGAPGHPQGFIGIAQGGYVAGLFVREECQSRGIGRKLLEHCQRRYPALALDVFVENARAVRFYAENGFVVTQTKENPTFGRMEHHMEWNAGQAGSQTGTVSPKK